MSKPTPIRSIEDAAALTPRAREVYTYVIPPTLHRYGIKSVGFVLLTPNEEMMAQRRANNNAIRMTFEMVKESLRVIDGRAVSQADGTVEAALEGMHPKVRNLLVTAYTMLHNPKDDEINSFLSSQQTEVG